MQLGSGSFDLKPSLNAFSRTGKWNYGGQASAVIRLDENDEGYTLGDRLEATGWVAYEPMPWISFSGRLKAASVGQIDGTDPVIRAPVQTADPDNHGGETLEALFGVNLAGQSGWQKGHRLRQEEQEAGGHKGLSTASRKVERVNPRPYRLLVVIAKHSDRVASNPSARDLDERISR